MSSPSGLPPPAPAFPPIALSVLIAGVPDVRARGDVGISVLDVVHDARAVTPGALFCCVVGERADGHEFARSALGAGAAALLVERWLDLPATQVLVPSVRRAMGPVAALAFREPASSMTMLGVTGTNGKTTTTYLLDAIARRAGHRVGRIGTTGAMSAGMPVRVERTTPEAPDLHRVLARMRDDGVGLVAMEVSSHALAQHRVGGLVFDAAAFTNLSQDHLDFHPSMEAYFAAQARLFDGRCPRAVNADDPWGRRLAAELRYGLGSSDDGRLADVRAEDVELRADGTAFRLVTPAGVRAVRTPL
ncbi:MAG TPA: Mur ligase family protein, partial [Actinomycetota bacterium]|nr:Mur ligase family protein [Actinomycetota bacterium]